MKHRASTAVSHLLVNFFEVSVVLLLRVRHVKNAKSSFVDAGRYQPIGISCHDNVEVISRHHWIPVLGLDSDQRLCNQLLQNALALLGTSPDSFIEESDDAILEMCVECPCDVL